MNIPNLKTKIKKKKLPANYASIGKFIWSHRKPTDYKSFSMYMASGLVTVADGLALLATGIFLYWYYIGWGSTKFWDYSFTILLATTTVLLLFAKEDLYSIKNIFNPSNHYHKIFGILIATFLMFLSIVFALKMTEQFSRVWCFSWFLSSALLICLERYLCSLLFKRWVQARWFSQKIVIVGSGEQAKRLLKQLKGKKEPWISIVGVFDDRIKRISSSFMGYPVLGTLDDLKKYCRNNRIDDIIVALPWSADKRLFNIIKKLEELPLTISLCSDLAGFQFLRPKYSSLGGVPMLDVVTKPLDGWGYFLKAAEDKILGLCFLILFMPLGLLIALAIKLESDGPILYRQKRHGFNNKEFMMTKFRSMYHGCQQKDIFLQAEKNDPRVTRVGAFLRRTSLDELPQLLNVICGTMSVVGPRPHAIQHNEEYCKTINNYFSRHRVKPGITGWAQVNGLRGETKTPGKMKARYDYDVHYIEQWSLLLDIKIMIMTVSVVASQKNAY